MVAHADQSGNQKLRAYGLWTDVAAMMERGSRDAKVVADALQGIKDPNFRPAIPATGIDFTLQLREWARFFREVRKREVKLEDLRKLPVPEAAAEFGWIIPMLKGDLPSTIYGGIEKSGRMKMYKLYNDLDAEEHDRVADHPYIVRVRNREEADEELKNLSANQLKQHGISGITLAEYLQLHDFYYWKTGDHLTKDSWTLCSGSRASDGDFPSVCCHPGCGGVGVDACLPDVASGGLRSRVAVSSPLPMAV